MMAKSHIYYTKTNMVMKQWRNGKMNDKMFTALMKKYDAEIEDALYRINALNEHNLIIPEHTDILGEVDKMLQKISSAEDRLAALRRHYGEKKAKEIL
jgi:hypothetical protein